MAQSCSEVPHCRPSIPTVGAGHPRLCFRLLYRYIVHQIACVCRAGALSMAPSGTAGMDLRRWEVDPKRVILGERLAVGGFAEVFVGKYEVRHKCGLGVGWPRVCTHFHGSIKTYS